MSKYLEGEVLEKRRQLYKETIEQAQKLMQFVEKKKQLSQAEKETAAKLIKELQGSEERIINEIMDFEFAKPTHTEAKHIREWAEHKIKDTRPPSAGFDIRQLFDTYAMNDPRITELGKVEEALLAYRGFLDPWMHIRQRQFPKRDVAGSRDLADIFSRAEKPTQHSSFIAEARKFSRYLALNPRGDKVAVAYINAIEQNLKRLRGKQRQQALDTISILMKRLSVEGKGKLQEQRSFYKNYGEIFRRKTTKRRKI